jgi:hypothetical protein
MAAESGTGLMHPKLKRDTGKSDSHITCGGLSELALTTSMAVVRNET